MSLQCLEKGTRRTAQETADITSFPVKVMGQLLLDVISKHVKENKVISSQHRFTKGKLCLTSKRAFCHGRTGRVDEGRSGGVVYLDFSMAFDTVSHNIVIGELRVGSVSGQWVC